MPGHVVDVDDHAVVDEGIDQRLSERRQSILVARRPGSAGTTRVGRYARNVEAKSLQQADFKLFLTLVEPEAVVRRAAVLGRVVLTLAHHVADVDGILPCRRTAKGVVKIVDGEDVTHAHVMVALDLLLDEFGRTRRDGGRRLHRRLEGEHRRFMRPARVGSQVTVEQVVDLDAENDRELAVLNDTRGLLWCGDDPEPSMPRTA